MKNIVYGLKDPRNDVYMYIGKSTVGDSRALQHLVKSHSKKVNEWVKELEDKWLYPIVEIIEEVEDVNVLSEREKYHINYYIGLNPNLLNIKLVDSNINPTRTEEDENDFENLCRLINKYSDILKNERTYRKITQEHMADIMDVSRSTVSLCERNGDVTLNTVKKYLAALKGIEIVTKQRCKRVSSS